jgi:hypothetical protein
MHIIYRNIITRIMICIPKVVNLDNISIIVNKIDTELIPNIKIAIMSIKFNTFRLIIILANI